MSDPSLRRLLDASHIDGEQPHWQIQKRHEVRDHERALVMQDIQARAMKHAAVLGGGQIKNSQQLLDAINAMLRQADTYDRRVFETMGVNTIWVGEYRDIPRVLDSIAG